MNQTFSPKNYWLADALAFLGMFLGVWMIYYPLAHPGEISESRNYFLILLGAADILLCFGFVAYLLKLRLRQRFELPAYWIVALVLVLIFTLGGIALMLNHSHLLRREQLVNTRFFNHATKFKDSIRNLAPPEALADPALDQVFWVDARARIGQLREALRGSSSPNKDIEADVGRVEEKLEQMDASITQLQILQRDHPSRQQYRRDYQEKASSALTTIDQALKKSQNVESDMEIHAVQLWHQLYTFALLAGLSFLGISGLFLLQHREYLKVADSERQWRDQESFHRFLIDHHGEAIALLDAHGSIKYANETFQHLWGMNEETAQGRNLLDLVHPDDLMALRQSYQSWLLHFPETQRAAYRFRQADGWKSMEVIGKNCLDHAYFPSMVVHLRPAVGAAPVRQESTALDALAQGSREVVLRVNRDGLVRYAHAPDEFRTVFPPDRLTNHALREVLPPAIADTMLGFIQSALDSKQVRQYEFTLPGPEGKLEAWDSSLVPNNDQEVLAVCRNETRYRVMEESLEDARGRLRRAEEDLERRERELRERERDLEQSRQEARRFEEDLYQTRYLEETHRETTPDGVLFLPSDRTWTSNRRFEEIWGLDHDESQHRSLNSLLKLMTDTIVEGDDLIERLVRSESDTRSHGDLHLRDGRTLEVHAQLRRDRDRGRSTRAIYFRDVSEQRNQYLSRDREYEQARHLVESPANPVYLYDLENGQPVLWNRSAFQQIGLGADDWNKLGDRIAKVVRQAQGRTSENHNHEREVYENDLTWKVGREERNFLHRFSIVDRQPNGTPRLVTGMLTDLSRHHETLAETKKDLEKSRSQAEDYRRQWQEIVDRGETTKRQLDEFRRQWEETRDRLSEHSRRLELADSETREARERSTYYQNFMSGFDAIWWEGNSEFGKFHYVSPSTDRLLGVGPAEWTGSDSYFEEHIAGEDRSKVRDAWNRAVRDRREEQVAFRFRAADGKTSWWEGAFKPSRDTGNGTRLRGVFLPRADSPKPLRDLVGMQRLADGIAQDFSGHLSTILGYCDVLLESIPEHQPNREYAQEIHEAADKAANLSHQLRDFGLPRKFHLGSLDLNKKAWDAGESLRQILGPNIELKYDLANQEMWVNADATQVEVALQKLAQHAVSVMAAGGEWTISTRSVEFDRMQEEPHAEIPPGSYVVLTCHDQSLGFDPNSLKQMFEPYAVKVELLPDRGLALATAQSIFEACNAHVTAESERGKGTKVKVYFQRSSR